MGESKSPPADKNQREDKTMEEIYKMVNVLGMDYEQLESLDESERSYYEDAIASGDPDESEAMLRYFNLDCY